MRGVENYFHLYRHWHKLWALQPDDGASLALFLNDSVALPLQPYG